MECITSQTFVLDHEPSPTLSRLALQFTNRNLQETSYSAGKNKCKCFSWTFCASSLDIRSSSCQKLAHVKLAHTQRTQKPTKWAKTALESTNSTDLQPLARKFVLKKINLLDFVHFLLKTR